MATYYIDPSATINGDGSQASPYNAVPSANFSGSNEWRVRAGQTLNLSSTQHAVGSNVIIKAYGEGDTKPKITGNASTMLMVFSNDNVTLENLVLQRLGTVGGNGVNLGGGAAENFSALSCEFLGFGNHIYADKAQSPYIYNCDFTGGTIAIQAAARDGVDCTNWRLLNNRFNRNGTDLLLKVSEDSTFTSGAFSGLEIRNNNFENSLLTAIQLNCAAYVFSGDISVTGPSTLTRSVNWPPWPIGSQIYLTNFSNRANFGLFTVASISGTSLAVTETSLVSEGSSSGKQVWLWRADTSFSGLQLIGNTIRKTGATPILIDTMIGGSIYQNTIESCITNGVGAAGIETGNCDGLLIEQNTISDMKTAVFDGMGIFLDNAVRNSVVTKNRISDCLGASNDNSGAGLAIFNCTNNLLYSNLVTNCKRGLWMGGSGTTANFSDQNTFAYCDIGIRINSSPLASSNKFRNSVTVSCTTDIQDNASQTFENILSGTPQTLEIDTFFYPKAGSSLIEAGDWLGLKQDFIGTTFQNPPSIGAYEYVRPRTMTTTRELRT
jgi:hypothetical protein